MLSALSSSIRVRPIALARLGPSFYWCDSLGAGVVGLVIMRGAAGCWWSDLRVLVDSALPRDRLRQIRAVVGAVEGVLWTSLVKAPQISIDAWAAVLRRLNWVENIDIYVYPDKNTSGLPSGDPAAPESLLSGTPGRVRPRGAAFPRGVQDRKCQHERS